MAFCLSSSLSDFFNWAIKVAFQGRWKVFHSLYQKSILIEKWNDLHEIKHEGTLKKWASECKVRYVWLVMDSGFSFYIVFSFYWKLAE